MCYIFTYSICLGLLRRNCWGETSECNPPLMTSNLKLGPSQKIFGDKNWGPSRFRFHSDFCKIIMKLFALAALTRNWLVKYRDSKKRRKFSENFLTRKSAQRGSLRDEPESRRGNDLVKMIETLDPTFDKFSVFQYGCNCQFLMSGDRPMSHPGYGRPVDALDRICKGSSRN